jgi:hypothetical protein
VALGTLLSLTNSLDTFPEGRMKALTRISANVDQDFLIYPFNSFALWNYGDDRKSCRKARRSVFLAVTVWFGYFDFLLGVVP